MKRPLFSFVIPTYNSEKTLAKTLMSIMQQGFELELLEILIIDGGSTDATLKIAAKYGALIIENPKRLPEYAKFIGMNKATGKYIVKMDSDEAFTSNLQLKKRLQLVEKWPDVKCVLADRLKKPTEGNWGIANEYINLFGDPFSFFVYKSKGTVLQSFKKSVKSIYDNVLCKLEFKQNDLLPIADGGTTMLDLDYMRENFKKEMQSESFASFASQLIMTKTGCCGCVIGDEIIHYSRADLKSFLKKLRFRVISNLFYKQSSGFSVRAQSNARLKVRKLLYPLYAVSIILPLYDSCKISVRQKDVSLMLHFFYVYYILVAMLWYTFKSFIIKPKANTEY